MDPNYRYPENEHNIADWLDGCVIRLFAMTAVIVMIAYFCFMAHIIIEQTKYEEESTADGTYYKNDIESGNYDPLTKHVDGKTSYTHWDSGSLDQDKAVDIVNSNIMDSNIGVISNKSYADIYNSGELYSVIAKCMTDHLGYSAAHVEESADGRSSYIVGKARDGSLGAVTVKIYPSEEYISNGKDTFLIKSTNLKCGEHKLASSVGNYTSISVPSAHIAVRIAAEIHYKYD